MREKSTDDLSQELMEASSLDEYLRENAQHFTGRGAAALLEERYARRSISKAALARQAGMSEVYLHQVFSGRRNPSRDRLLCLCVGLEATVEETQQILKRACCAPLYPRSRRDSMILYGIVHRIPLSEINDKLFAENEKTLFWPADH